MKRIGTLSYKKNFYEKIILRNFLCRGFDFS
jgi:hypothetical protein